MKKLISTKDNLSLITKEKPLTQHELDLKAERSLLMTTKDLSPRELSNFLFEYSIPRSEYDTILHKHRHVMAALKAQEEREKADGSN